MPRCDKCWANAVQAGSLNRPGYLRFDFNWQGPLTEEQLGQVEEVTNQAVQADYEVHTFTEQLDKAKAMGALALFGERYPEIVRVVEIGGPFSLELCGAPMCTTRRRSAGHDSRRVVGRLRGAPGRGLRRAGILPPPGQGACADGRAGRDAEGAVGGGAGPGGQPRGKAQGRREGARTNAAGQRAGGRGQRRRRAERIGNVRVVAQRMSSEMTAADLRSLAGDIRGKLGNEAAVVALIAAGDGNTVPYAVATNTAAQDLGLRADDLIKPLSAAVDGRGGASPTSPRVRAKTRPASTRHSTRCVHR
ncbi:alanyl-tRNA synthetase domain protein [Mycobacterium xenopi 4042]|uniref:Alanine--tRNA ligase n=1 Tax=Mycobacterium xenopi 4042 TaxID=1299334 RepID=X7ZK81_MYCXE|nr:alanyl-tRNA synthetase domain protein [Mycobacterium xenopi 4042]